MPAGLGAVIVNAGPWAAFLGLAGTLLWYVATGRLVPRKIHEQAVAAEKQRGDDWKETARLLAAGNEIRDKQLDEILTFVRRAPTPAPTPLPSREAA